VRDADLDHPDELRVDLDPVPGVAWDQVRAVAHVVQRGESARVLCVSARPGRRPARGAR
jgi:hypothetical protein